MKYIITLRAHLSGLRLAVAAAGSLVMLCVPSVAFAQATGPAAGGDGGAAAPAGACGAKIGEGDGTPPAPTGTQYCTPFDETNGGSVAKNSDHGNEFIKKYVTPAVKAASALAGIAITASVVYGGIQYATAGGDSGKVSAAKQRILQAIFILLAYIFFYAFMRWLLPGGLPG